MTMKNKNLVLFRQALASVAFMLVTSSADAQLLFGSRLGQAHYQGDDTKIIMQIGADMMRNAADGESRPWSNPQTGNSGTITVLRSYKHSNMPCRDAEVNSKLKDRNVVYVLPLCQIAEGSWKIAAK
ncbi:hypothetical protein N825_28790 [Skermanella stibiiresistens SB22]|uniref:Surface antigen domain-containing protein n=2 Tax=Skermanella TaxID=204447 RepID=W9GRG4_9PROT|nr:hypothetical protein N825_28790 [Skermanella stibiiresistens SB22]